MESDKLGMVPGFNPLKAKLGRKPPNLDKLAKHPRFAKYILPERIASPPSFEWTSKVNDWGMLLNDQLGDCVIAGIFHVIKLWTTYAGHRDSLGDLQALDCYERFCGYRPGDPSSDQGCVMLDVLNAWKSHGVGFGHTLIASAALEHGSIKNVHDSVYLFGAAWIGLDLPFSAQAQVGQIWSVTSGGASEPGTWGGHCVPIVAYKPGLLCCVTWGKLQWMTEAFYLKYCSEAYAVASVDWISANGKSPSGFDMKTLLVDLYGV